MQRSRSHSPTWSCLPGRSFEITAVAARSWGAHGGPLFFRVFTSLVFPALRARCPQRSATSSRRVNRSVLFSFVERRLRLTRRAFQRRGYNNIGSSATNNYVVLVVLLRHPEETNFMWWFAIVFQRCFSTCSYWFKAVFITSDTFKIQSC